MVEMRRNCEHYKLANECCHRIHLAHYEASRAHQDDNEGGSMARAAGATPPYRGLAAKDDGTKRVSRVYVVIGPFCVALSWAFFWFTDKRA
jgi:hypothetical protein